ILYTMADMGLRPDRGHVKSARVVGEVMGRLHPHGDGAIYDALVRMVQPWAMRLPMVDGHGNFGSPDAGPAAMRYTECRMAAAALPMTESIDEQTVDFRPNYDSLGPEKVIERIKALVQSKKLQGIADVKDLTDLDKGLRLVIEVKGGINPDALLEQLYRLTPMEDSFGINNVTLVDGQPRTLGLKPL